MPLLLVRHAIALGREEWSQSDRLRPLSAEGRAQALGLVCLLEHFDIEAILSSPALRCVETVEPLADVLGIRIDVVDELDEGSGAAAATLVDPAAQAPILLCTHGDVVPQLFAALAGRGSFDEEEFRCAKGSTWVIGETGEAAKYLPPPAVN